jgi:hypothetical protein
MDASFAARQRLGQCEQPAGDPLDIAVDWDGRYPESDRSHSRGGVGADPRKFLQSGEVAWKATPGHDRFGASVQVSGPRVVTQARPQAEYFIQIRPCEGLHRREPAYEVFIVGYDSGDRRLLQHDLAEPDLVWVRRPPRFGTPGQAAAMAIVPGQQVASGKDGG